MLPWAIARNATRGYSYGRSSAAATTAAAGKVAQRITSSLASSGCVAEDDAQTETGKDTPDEQISADDRNGRKTGCKPRTCNEAAGRSHPSCSILFKL
ncbi:hypothetical protein CGCS363_v004792 [Colletotrichum siamense]|uniref:uncharacterized protein n=1 Tax=Colletotrichum siamense TaxID=690259 RepID=UPI0018723308|nr:uncharacterized protein CGCS363_v004792 [Colletotrichum siamense]KAF5504971.1 hypothetical protein CGCS363_v004792 [Colletotrichum siamense]